MGDLLSEQKFMCDGQARISVPSIAKMSSDLNIFSCALASPKKRVPRGNGDELPLV
jgi:hypothetical protein